MHRSGGPLEVRLKAQLKPLFSEISAMRKGPETCGECVPCERRDAGARRKPRAAESGEGRGPAPQYARPGSLRFPRPRAVRGTAWFCGQFVGTKFFTRTWL